MTTARSENSVWKHGHKNKNLINNTVIEKSRNPLLTHGFFCRKKKQITIKWVSEMSTAFSNGHSSSDGRTQRFVPCALPSSCRRFGRRDTVDVWYGRIGKYILEVHCGKLSENEIIDVRFINCELVSRKSFHTFQALQTCTNENEMSALAYERNMLLQFSASVPGFDSPSGQRAGTLH